MWFDDPQSFDCLVWHTIPSWKILPLEKNHWMGLGNLIPWIDDQIHGQMAPLFMLSMSILMRIDDEKLL